jgi:hypothetical protein
VNDDGEITPDDKTIIGSYQPDFTYGLKNTFRYHGFDLSIFIEGVSGRQILNRAMRQNAVLTGRTNSLGLARERWRSPEHPGNGKVPKANIDIYGVRRQASTYDIQDGSYLRIRNVTLGYTFSPNLLKSSAVSSARVYITTLNPYIYTKYNGFNPQVSSHKDNSLTPGIDYYNYPLSKNITLGINITF